MSEDRTALSYDQRELLEKRVLPTARRWVSDNPPGTLLYRHGMKTLHFWGEGSAPESNDQ